MQFYSGGLAELVQHPSTLTFKYLQTWLSAQTLASAAKLLGLPHWPTSQPLLELQDETLVVNLQTEESILYAKTIFTYAARSDINQDPSLKVSPQKIFNPANWSATFKILSIQTAWLANPQKIIDQCNHWIDDLKADSLAMPDLWSRVLAIGIVAEFFHHSYLSDWKQAVDSGAAIDWLTSSLKDQQKVKTGEWTLKQYLQEYGDRSDNDYELTSPRWSEIPDVIQKRITQLKISPVPQRSQTQLSDKAKLHVQLIQLRGLARKYTLVRLSLLRKKLKLSESVPSKPKKTVMPPKHPIKTSGTGRPVSPGEVEGTVLQITSADDSIPENTIGVFPNASPQFTSQFPKCAGLIFLVGGQTSHGAIVAREFGIPAIVDPSATGISSGSAISLNASTGQWHTR